MNKRERMDAVLRGQTPDRIPAGFWFHYPFSSTVDELVEGQWKLYQHTDMDIIKVMHEFRCELSHPLTCAADWKNVRLTAIGTPRMEAQLEIIRRLRRLAGDDVMIFATAFGPFQHACYANSDAAFMQHCTEDLDAVIAGASALTEELEACADAFLDAGADGLYYSAQYGEIGRFSHETWSRLVKPLETRILSRAKQKGKYALLHICGERFYDAKIHLDWYADYPADIVNWSVSDNGLSLPQGRELFRRPILGGMNNRGEICTGTPESIAQEARAAISSAGTAGFMLGADCTVRGTPDLDRIAAAVRAAHEYEL